MCARKPGSGDGKAVAEAIVTLRVGVLGPRHAVTGDGDGDGGGDAQPSFPKALNRYTRAANARAGTLK
jgi:hypothetical protein